jgi:hypothetical protein
VYVWVCVSVCLGGGVYGRKGRGEEQLVSSDNKDFH